MHCTCHEYFLIISFFASWCAHSCFAICQHLDQAMKLSRTTMPSSLLPKSCKVTPESCVRRAAASSCSLCCSCSATSSCLWASADFTPMACILQFARTMMSITGLLQVPNMPAYFSNRVCLLLTSLCARSSRAVIVRFRSATSVLMRTSILTQCFQLRNNPWTAPRPSPSKKRSTAMCTICLPQLRIAEVEVNCFQATKAVRRSVETSLRCHLESRTPVACSTPAHFCLFSSSTLCMLSACALSSFSRNSSHLRFSSARRLSPNCVSVTCLVRVFQPRKQHCREPRS
mmetsp:Transcript_35729/g.106768  ORF Transcript_35729/g.106768 Transcript_35729/m.106768 type:complete len:287 (+) Transcript_35729:606-1466(+)